MIENADHKNDRSLSQERDRKTIEAIGAIYCRAHHSKNPQGANKKLKEQGASSPATSTSATHSQLCPQCAEVVEYAMARTKRCPNNHEGNCADCEIHCFNGSMRERVKQMMAYAAPRMLVRHPIMTVRYLRKKARAGKTNNPATGK